MTTLEMIKELLEHKEREYISKEYNSIAFFCNGNIFRKPINITIENFYIDNELFNTSEIFLSLTDWMLITEVDFITAVNSKKRILPKFHKNYYIENKYKNTDYWLKRLSYMEEGVYCDLINGKWLIEI